MLAGLIESVASLQGSRSHCADPTTGDIRWHDTSGHSGVSRVNGEPPNEEGRSALDHSSDWEEEVRRHREVWAQKPLLRRIYQRWYAALQAEALPGRTLEVGGGGGHLKEHWPEILSSDIVSAPWLDFQADCLALPFRDGVFDNVVGVDIIHHLFDPDPALREIARVIRPGGRAIFFEPYVSWFSGLVRGRFHHEKQDLSQDIIYNKDKRPEDANLAIPTRLFVRNRRDFERRFPGLRIRRVKLTDMLAYPLTRGFGAPNLLPEPLLCVINRVEPLFAPLTRWLGFKMLVVLEKVDRGGGGLDESSC